VEIGHWVLREACAQAKRWQDRGHPDLAVSVNLSARQFEQPDVVTQVAAALADTGLEARFLDLEITESKAMHSAEGAVHTLRGLKDLGVRLSIDDFGTGYSSLAYLKRFPIDTLKIDQSFIRDIATDAGDAAVTTALIAMAHDLKLHVVAEGVETDAQLGLLRDRHCDRTQGFLFSRPLPAHECEHVLSRSWPAA
jgi:EAL domain-containing protein (putative c-di-GMP-specific phosphodiesterase class I)